MTHFVSSCLYIETVCDHIRLIYREIEEKITKGPEKTEKRLDEFNKQLTDAVQLYVKLIE